MLRIKPIPSNRKIYRAFFEVYLGMVVLWGGMYFSSDRSDFEQHAFTFPQKV